MSTPHYTSAAEQDLHDILNYTAQDKPCAAISWVEKIEARCLLIASATGLSEAIPQLGSGVRASSLGRYVIFHRQANDRVKSCE